MRIRLAEYVTAPLAPRSDDIGRELELLDDLPDSVAEALFDAFQVPIGGRNQNLGEHRSGGRHAEGVAVECPDLVVGPVGDDAHHFLGTTDRRHRKPATEGLGQTDDVRLDAEHPGGTAPADGEPGLDLVKCQQGAVVVGQGPQTLEETGSGTRMPQFISTGSRMTPATSPG